MESMPNVSRSGETGLTASPWLVGGKVDCCMLEHRKHVAVIYTLFYRNFSHFSNIACSILKSVF